MAYDQTVEHPASHYQPTEYGYEMEQLARWVTLCPELSVTK